MRNVSKQEVRKLIGKSIYAVREDGSIVTGKLVRVHDDKLIVAPLVEDNGKLVQTRAILPLVLFDLLAIGTLPLWGGGYGGGFGGGYGPGPGYGGCGCQPYGYGKGYNGFY
ncbi:hypothetical protein [Paenibacillus arenilitoris]|uniref:50S ribosomal protein L33 n=1 Tax=Paenibacillus arenilitoris TaxID=2772299 RepID=A0A927H4S4_9BACL|nr:hypothetical protein [Paenibacillus arenilitoris]MBD2867692.1 hypothetical protein [Paenibacillus arenilitoris]